MLSCQSELFLLTYCHRTPVRVMLFGRLGWRCFGRSWRPPRVRGRLHQPASRMEQQDPPARGQHCEDDGAAATSQRSAKPNERILTPVRAGRKFWSRKSLLVSDPDSWALVWERAKTRVLTDRFHTGSAWTQRKTPQHRKFPDSGEGARHLTGVITLSFYE